MTRKQFIFIIACFIQGSSFYTMYYYHMAGNEAWLCLLAGILLGMLVAYLYGALGDSYPSCCLVQINEAVFGRIPGKILSFFYLYTFIVSCSMTMRETSQFVAGDLLMETDWIPILTVFVLACAWASNAGTRYFASVSTFMCILMYVFTVLLFLLLLPMIEFKHLLPLGGHSALEYGRSVLYCTLMPFSELVVLLFLVPDFKEAREQKNLWKQFVLGILIGAPFIIILVLRDTLVLGPLLTAFYYPSYEVVRLINFNVLSHIESLYGVLLIFILFFKSAVIFYCITKALARIFGCRKNIVFTAFTTGLMLLCTQQLCSSNVSLMNLALHRIPYVLLAVQVGLPALTLAVSRVKNTVQNKRSSVKCG